MVKDITDINNAAKPGKTRGAKTIHHPIGHAFNQLIAILYKILVLVFSLALPKADPGVLNILGDLPTAI